MTNSTVPISLKKTLLQKEMQLVFIAGFFIMLNLTTMLNLLPLYIIYTGGTEFSAGVQNSIFSISAVALRFLLGPIADTKGRKGLLLIGSFIFATSPLAILAAPNYWIQVLARIYQAVGIATFLSSASSVIADHTPYEYRGRVIGLYRALLSFALMIGPSLGLRLINSMSYDALFIFNSLICFISFFLILNLPKEKIVQSDNLKISEISSSMKLLLKNPNLLNAYWGIGVVSLSNGALMAYLTIYALNSGIITYPGIYFTIFAGIGIFATSFSGYLSDKIGREKLILPSILCLGLGICGLSLLNSLGSSIFYISALISGIGYSASSSTLITMVIDNADEKTRATALVIQENAIDLAMAVGAFLLGLGTIRFELSTLFFILGIVTVISAIGLYRANSVS